MTAVIIATFVASIVGVVTWLVDQWLLRCRTAFRAVVASVLAAVATWIAVVIHTALWLKVPGAYGPVQYWHNDPGGIDFMMSVRAGTLFLTIAGFALAGLLIILTVVALFLPAESNRW